MLDTMSMPSFESFGSFSLFSSLPLELRRKVWTAALPASRTVALKPEHNAGCGLPIQLVHASLPTPSVFHVNREARQEAFMTYKPCFQTYEEVSMAKCAYLDFDADTVYCNFHMLMTPRQKEPTHRRKRSLTPTEQPQTALETLAAQEGHHIKRLAVHFGAPFSPWFTVDVVKPIRATLASLLQFERLDEVTLVWMDEADPRNHFAPAHRASAPWDVDIDRAYLADLDRETKALQDALNEAQTLRQADGAGWRAPLVKLLVER